MTTTLALIPILALLALAGAALLFSNLRQAWLAAAKSKRDDNVQRILREDTQAQAALITELVEGTQPVGEALEAFLRRRSSLVPGLVTDEPAAWDVDALGRLHDEQFESRASEINRQLGFGVLVAALIIVSAATVAGAVIYGFTAGTPLTGAQPTPFAPPLPGPADPLSPSGSNLNPAPAIDSPATPFENTP
jgi:hypothetical protein